MQIRHISNIHKILSLIYKCVLFRGEMVNEILDVIVKLMQNYS